MAEIKDEIDVDEGDADEGSPDSPEINWEQRAKQLEEKAKVSREKRKELKDSYEKRLADKEAELKSFKDAQSKAQPDEPNYARLAFLHTKGIEHPDDIKVVEEEAGRLKLSLSDTLQMEHIKAKLTTNKETREAQSAMPKGKGRPGGTAQSEVEYWLAKGGLPNDQELAEKVVNARMRKDSSQQKFSDEMYIG